MLPGERMLKWRGEVSLRKKRNMGVKVLGMDGYMMCPGDERWWEYVAVKGFSETEKKKKTS